MQGLTPSNQKVEKIFTYSIERENFSLKKNYGFKMSYIFLVLLIVKLSINKT